jgi:phospholipase C
MIRPHHEQTAPEADKTAAMAYWTGRDLPFYHGLAGTFPVADRWVNPR